MSSGLYKSHLMYKKDLALNNLQWLICHKTKPTNLPNLDIYTVMGNTHLFPHNELVHLPYIAVANNTRAD